MAAASRSVRQRFGARGKKNLCFPLFDLSRYVRYRDSILMNKISHAENGTYFLTLQVIIFIKSARFGHRSPAQAPEAPAKADAVDKTQLEESLSRNCMAGRNDSGQTEPACHRHYH